MVSVSFALNGYNGDSIVFDGSAGYYLTTGFSGVGMVPTEVRLTPSAADGAAWRGSRRGVRELDLPVTVLGTDRADVEAKLRRLAAALSDRVGAPKLVATYDDDTAYELEVHYTGGAETQYGGDANATSCRWVLQLQAPDPYFTAVTPASFSVAADNRTRGLLPNLLGLEVKSSQALGSIDVQNPGEVDAYPTWVINGPATSVTIAIGGVGFTYDADIAAGEVITVDTRTATVTDAAGDNMYGNLAAAPKLFALPPGITTVAITAEGADTDTRISAYYKPRREVLH